MAKKRLDSELFELGFRSCLAIPQIFLHTNITKDIGICLVKDVDDLLSTGSVDQIWLFLNSLGTMFTLDSVAYGPGRLRFSDLNLVRYKYFSPAIDRNEKLESVKATQQVFIDALK